MGVFSVRDGFSIYRMFVAPSHVSDSIASEISNKAEEKLFEIADARGVNAFIKRLVRRNGEYKAIVIIESEDEDLVAGILNEVESQTVKMGLKIINLLKDELKSF